MAKNEKQNIYWIKTGECFAGKGQGEDITDYFYDEKDKPIQVDRLKQLKKDGSVSIEKPDSYEHASEQELNQLKKTIKEQTETIVDLKNDLSSVPKNITQSRKTIAELKAELVEKDIESEEKLKAANEKILQLEIDLENATKPE